METFEFITKDELLRIVEGLISSQVAQAVEGFVRKSAERSQEFSVLERVVRVKEEFKPLRELESTRFEAMESRFQSVMRDVVKGFELIEKRVKALHREMDARFKKVDAWIDALQREMDKRLEAIDKSFEAMDAHLEALNKRFSFMQWFMSAKFGLASVLVGILWLYRG